MTNDTIYPDGTYAGLDPCEGCGKPRATRPSFSDGRMLCALCYINACKVRHPPDEEFDLVTFAALLVGCGLFVGVLIALVVS